MTRIVGVFGGNDEESTVLALAEEVGVKLAKRGAVVLTGGRHELGDVGDCTQVKTCVMSAAAEVERARILGILRRDEAGLLPPVRLAAGGWAAYLTTGLGDARNLVNGFAVDIAIALPGGAGTASEVFFALVAGRPVIQLRWDLETLRSEAWEGRDAATGEVTDLTKILDKTWTRVSTKGLSPDKTVRSYLKNAELLSHTKSVDEAVDMVTHTKITEYRGRGVKDLQFRDEGPRRIGDLVAKAVDSLANPE